MKIGIELYGLADRGDLFRRKWPTVRIFFKHVLAQEFRVIDPARARQVMVRPDSLDGAKVRFFVCRIVMSRPPLHLH